MMVGRLLFKPIYKQQTTNIIACSTIQGQQNGLNTLKFQFLNTLTFFCKRSVLKYICTEKFLSQKNKYHEYEHKIKKELEFMNITDFLEDENTQTVKS